MEKENKLVNEQEAKENEIVELKDDDLSTITAGSGNQVLDSHKNEVLKNKNDVRRSNTCVLDSHKNEVLKNLLLSSIFFQYRFRFTQK
ncbi:MAG: hypothetical protein MJ250_03760 [Alphaproteobacteria bacterium]|nr:hypothetical protein [Alphaproteobacteria bacterium]